MNGLPTSTTIDPPARLAALLEEPAPSVRQREQAMAREVSQADLGRLILFGAGTLGRHALGKLRSAGVEPLAFADNDPKAWGTTVDHLRVLGPSDAAAQFGGDVLFVVTIYTGRKVQLQLAAMGLRVAPFAKLFMKFPGVLWPYWSLDWPSHTLESAAVIRRGLDVWAEESSRIEYVAQVRYRLWQDEDLPPSLPPAETYFPDDLFVRDPNETFVDCGAYDGDSLRGFLGRYGQNFRRIIAIEPDPMNCRRLRDYVNALDAPYHDKVKVLELAAGARREVVQFMADGEVWSGVNEAGAIGVTCAPLDEALVNETPTFIKMDIEGAEPEAMAGAARVLREQAPVLAICLYHRAEHLWELPLLIKSLNPDYHLFLRRYSDATWEQVCYAVPTHRLRQ